MHEHEWSFLHHVKLEKSSGQCKHECNLCVLTTDNLADFSKHLESVIHKDNLATYRFQKEIMDRPPCSNAAEKPYYRTPWQNNSNSGNYGSDPTYYNSFNLFNSGNNNYRDHQQYLKQQPYGNPNVNYNHYNAPGQGNFNQSFIPPLIPPIYPSEPYSNRYWSDSNNYYQNNNSTWFGPPGPSWKQYKHPSGVRYNQTNEQLTTEPTTSFEGSPPKKKKERKVVIPDDNVYFTPDVPMNLKNMPDLDYRKNMQTNSNMHRRKGLEKKLEAELKIQKRRERKRERKIQKTIFNLNRAQEIREGDLVTFNPINSKRKRGSAANLKLKIDKLRKKAKLVEKGNNNSKTKTVFLNEADSTTPNVGPSAESKTGPTVTEKNPKEVYKEETVKRKEIVSTRPSSSFASSVKKQMMRPPIISSADVSKRLLAERMKKYRVETPAAESHQQTSAGDGRLARSMSESEAEKVTGGGNGAKNNVKFESLNVSPRADSGTNNAWSSSVPISNKFASSSNSSLPKFVKSTDCNSNVSAKSTTASCAKKSTAFNSSTCNSSVSGKKSTAFNSSVSVNSPVCNISVSTKSIHQSEPVKSSSPDVVIMETTSKKDKSGLKAKLQQRPVNTDKPVDDDGSVKSAPIEQLQKQSSPSKINLFSHAQVYDSVKKLSSSKNLANEQKKSSHTDFAANIFTPPAEIAAAAVAVAAETSTATMGRNGLMNNTTANNEVVVDSFLKSMQPVLKPGAANNIEASGSSPLCNVTNIFPLNFVENNSFSQSLQQESSESHLDCLPIITKVESLQDPNEYVVIQQPHHHVPVETTTGGTEQMSDNSNSKMSKFTLLWDYCQKEEMYLAEISAAQQEFDELQKKAEECQKRKVEAEICYNEYKQLRQQLLASEATNDSSGNLVISSIFIFNLFATVCSERP